MANETRREIQSLLEDDKSISTRVGTRLTLSMLAEMDDKIEEFMRAEREARKALEERVIRLETGQGELKKNDIIEWVRNNTKLAFAIFILSVIAINEFQEYLLEAAKKWLGLP